MHQKTTLMPPQQLPALPVVPEGLLKDLRLMIDQTRQSIASTVNTGLTMLYWRAGTRILKEILLSERAEYGQKIVVTLSRQLAIDYGNGFSDKNLRRMIQFAEVFQNEQIVVSLTRQLSWSHFHSLITIKDEVITSSQSEELDG